MKPLLFCALFAGICLHTESSLQAQEEGSIKVVSFNIRYGTANDGENHWKYRREFLLETVQELNPDLLGTQETLAFQKAFLDDHLEAYDSIGVGRENGGDQGEMTAIFFRKERFEKLDEGHFWLSESPDKPGSVSWDSSLTRMVSWVKLRDQQTEGQPEFYFFNTHFDHIGKVARLESAKLIRRKIGEIAGEHPALLTGDFNTGEETAPYQALYGSGADALKLQDSYRVAHPQAGENEGTFNGFKPNSRGGARIDWIACTANVKVLEAGIEHPVRDGKVPSDHFPIWARVQLQTQTSRDR